MQDLEHQTAQPKRLSLAAKLTEFALYHASSAEQRRAFEAASADAQAALSALWECETYLAEREDVIDGDYGEPAPNQEMTLLREVRAAVARIEGSAP